jgi:hypothetical protein
MTEQEEYEAREELRLWEEEYHIRTLEMMMMEQQEIVDYE